MFTTITAGRASNTIFGHTNTLLAWKPVTITHHHYEISFLCDKINEKAAYDGIATYHDVEWLA